MKTLVTFDYNNLSQYYCFYCIIDQINATLVDITGFFQKHHFIDPTFLVYQTVAYIVFAMQYSLVAVVFQVFLVPIIRQHVFWVVFSDPLCLLDIK